MNTMDEATLDEWNGLYDLAVQLKALAPWTWMDDDDIFAVQSPADGELSYGIVMGGGGEAFGLALFVGEDGFEAYRRLVEDETEPESLEAGAMLRTLSMTFVDRGELDRRDHQVIKALGLKFRGRNVWPLFRSQRPGYAPWYLEREEVLLLDIALRFTLEVAEGLRDGSVDLYERVDEDEVYTLITYGGEPRRQWTSLPQEPAPIPPPQPDVALLERLKEQSDGPRGQLHVDCFLLPTLIAEKQERPYYPRCLLVVQDDGLIIGTEIMPPWALEAEQQQALVSSLERTGVIPASIIVPSPYVLRLVQPVADMLGAQAVVQEAPALEAIREDLIHEVMRG
ncbi:MAG: hypothetical protein HYX93_05510 [Chloroflexi bacterium]|nr:hypothetical protein [Chloroflexota bacterium]